jgi:hypothetical protein
LRSNSAGSLAPVAPPAPQLGQRQAVERPRGHDPADAQVPQPVGQLPGRLPGEGDGQDVAGVDRPVGRLPGDPPGEDAGLPRARPGQDRQWRGEGRDRLALAVVEVGEELVGGTLGHGSDGTGRV